MTAEDWDNEINLLYSYVAKFDTEEAKEDFETQLRNLTNLAYLKGVTEGKK